jgi:hypothetical protein
MDWIQASVPWSQGSFEGYRAEKYFAGEDRPGREGQEQSVPRSVRYRPVGAREGPWFS